MLWNLLYSYLNQKFLLGATNPVEDRSLKEAEQGQQGILENHYYAVMDMRDFPKDNLKLVRLRNPWGSEGVWTGPFCEEADDWEKYKAVKEDVKNAPKLKKADGSWWMSFTDFLTQFERVAVGKLFPDSWEVYSIESEWNSKTNGGRNHTLTKDAPLASTKPMPIKRRTFSSRQASTFSQRVTTGGLTTHSSGSRSTKTPKYTYH